MQKLIFALLLVVLQSTSQADLLLSYDEYKARAIELINAYTDELYPNHDVFARVHNSEQGAEIFEQLLWRKQAGNKLQKSPLALINDALISFHAQQQEINDNLIVHVLSDAQNVLESSGYSKKEKQSNWLALHFLLDYLRRFDAFQQVVDRDGKPVEKQEQKKRPKSYPHMPKSYKPQTKDTEKNKEKGTKDDQYLIAQANFAFPFWGQRVYSEVIRHHAQPFQEIDLPTTFRSPQTSNQFTEEMTVYPQGERQVELFLPSSFQPLQPVDPRARISRMASGGYLLTLTEDLPDVRIGLKPAGHEPLSPALLQIYTRPVGFVDSEWPSLIRQDLFEQFLPTEKHAPIAVAQAVANHISGKYLYSVNEKQALDPIEALKAGAFQCDMAAFIMVGILRDVYGIPSRVIGGYRAKKMSRQKRDNTFLVLPGEAHAWVEMYTDNKWHVFDPTPVKKDKKTNDDGDGEKDPYLDRKLENTLTPEQESQEKQNEQNSSLTSEKTHQDKLQKNTRQRISQKNENNSTDVNQANNVERFNISVDELGRMLEIGSLELEPASKKNPLRERALRVLLRTILNPNLESAKIVEYLSRAKSWLLSLAETRSIWQEAIQVHEEHRQGLASWARQTILRLGSQSLSTSYRELYRIKQSISLYASVLDRSGDISYPRVLIDELNFVLKEMYALAHPDSEDIALVNSFYQTLPSVARILLRQQYDLSTVGPNRATREFARLLRAGELNDIKLLSILSPLSNFILSSRPRPEYAETKTFEADVNRRVGRDLLPLQRFGDISRAVLSKPGKDIEENLRDGTAFVLGRRKRTQIEMGYGNEDSERISIVLYDTSGSMSGNPARFQAGLISAFVATALSDVSLSGRHRHRVVLVPFDDNPGLPVKITSIPEALDVLHHYQSKLHNTYGGTDIHKALMQAFALIADAEKRAGEPLAAANIILMTDGQSEVNVGELAKARNAISRETPLQVMFIAISQTNEQLMNFALESRKMGAEQGFYREFTDQHMNEILTQADQPVTHTKPGEIYSDYDASSLSSDVKQSLDRIWRLANEFSEDVRKSSSFKRASDNLQTFEKVKWNEAAHRNGQLEKWLQELRRLAYSNVFKDKELLERVVDDIFDNFHLITHVQLAELTGYEQEHLRHLLRYAAGLEDINL